MVYVYFTVPSEETADVYTNYRPSRDLHGALFAQISLMEQKEL